MRQLFVVRNNFVEFISQLCDVIADRKLLLLCERDESVFFTPLLILLDSVVRVVRDVINPGRWLAFHLRWLVDLTKLDRSLLLEERIVNAHHSHGAILRG